MARAYYNECEPFCVEWLRNLICEGLLPEGDVDERPIQEVQPADLVGYSQHHFFAGIGGWPLALRLAGWPDERPCWTGSVPCQPYSVAGKGEGQKDERHLWPEFHRLARECRPPVAFGEQVEGAIRFGWLDGVFADMEGEGYACGSAVLPAAGCGAPHIRHRIFWVAELPDGVAGSVANSARQPERPGIARVEGCTGVGWDQSAIDGATGDLANGDRGRQSQCGQPDSEPEQRGESASRRADAGGCGEVARQLGNSFGTGVPWDGRKPSGTEEGSDSQRFIGGSGGIRSVVASSWADFRVVDCLDGKTRRIPTQPELFPLAHGLPRDLGPLLAWLERLGVGAKDARRLLRAASRNRTGRLKGAGNAIVPQVAAEFIRAYMES